MLRFIIAENNEKGFENVEEHVGDVMYIAKETSSCSRRYSINSFLQKALDINILLHTMQSIPKYDALSPTKKQHY